MNFLGGSSNDYGYGIAVDGEGNSYITGFTVSNPFPTSPGAYDTTYNGAQDAFVDKAKPRWRYPRLFDLSGGHRAMTTVTGNRPWTLGLTPDVTGHTTSANFPITGGGALSGTADAFVTKLGPTGTLTGGYSRYLGGWHQTMSGALPIAVDAGGFAYATGYTTSVNFPTATGLVMTSLFTLVQDAYVTKLSAAGVGLPVYSTYLGSADIDGGGGIAFDGADNVYVISGRCILYRKPMYHPLPIFPVTANAYQGTYQGGARDTFVTRLNTALTGDASRVYSTLDLGGTGADSARGIAARGGYAYVARAPPTLAISRYGSSSRNWSGKPGWLCYKAGH